MEKIKQTIEKIALPDEKLISEVQLKLDNLTKPIGSLGKLEDIVKKICVIVGKTNPIIGPKTVFVLSADHGVTQENVSAYPQEVTSQMVYNFLNGGAAINVISRDVGADVIVVDVGIAEKIRVNSNNFLDKKINSGTKNFLHGSAMTKEEAIKSIETGIELVEWLLERNYNTMTRYINKNEIVPLVAVGDMGIGNSTSASAITSVVTGRSVEEVTGRGTGIDDAQYQKKIEVIKKSIDINKPDCCDGIDILSKLGGYEIGGIAGIILSCAANRIPVVLDGFITTAGALIATTLTCKCLHYMFAGHLSEEPGHKIQLEFLGLEPILKLNMRLGEGTGATLAMKIIEISCKILSEMATFDSAGVSRKI